VKEKNNIGFAVILTTKPNNKYRL